MSRFDRYVLSQLVTLFGFFSLVLVLVYWVNRAVLLFDRLIANGHSAAVFLEFSALTLPNVIRLVLPISAFAAAVYVTNRMRGESELVVAQATGFSPWRLARPVLAFGLLVAALVSVLTHVLVPVSTRILDQRTAEIAEDLTAGLLSDGEFLHPGDGITFFIREITPQTELRDILLSDARDPLERHTYTAQRALLLRTDAGPQLVMFDGMLQTLGTADRRLATTRFDEFSFGISDLLEFPQAGPREPEEAGTLELLRAGPALVAETGASRARLVFEGHARITQAAFAAVTPLIGFSAMLLGGFSRMGNWLQIVGAIFCLIAVELMANALNDLAGNTAQLWSVAYLPSLAALALSALFLWISGRPARRRRGSILVPA